MTKLKLFVYFTTTKKNDMPVPKNTNELAINFYTQTPCNDKTSPKWGSSVSDFVCNMYQIAKINKNITAEVSKKTVIIRFINGVIGKFEIEGKELIVSPEQRYKIVFDTEIVIDFPKDFQLVQNEIKEVKTDVFKVDPNSKEVQDALKHYEKKAKGRIKVTEGIFPMAHRLVDE